MQWEIHLSTPPFVTDPKASFVLTCSGMEQGPAVSWKAPLHVFLWAFCKARKKMLTENDPNSNLTCMKKSLQLAHNVSAVHK